MRRDWKKHPETRSGAIWKPLIQKSRGNQLSLISGFSWVTTNMRSTQLLIMLQPRWNVWITPAVWSGNLSRSSGGNLHATNIEQKCPKHHVTNEPINTEAGNVFSTLLSTTFETEREWNVIAGKELHTATPLYGELACSPTELLL